MLRGLPILPPLLVMLQVAGCRDQEPTPHDPTAPQQTASAVSLRVAGAEEFEQVLVEHRGKVVLVDFWATWCMPCVAQFPHTVEIAHELESRGLQVITVSLNEVEEEPDVLEFLQLHEAKLDNLLSKYGGGSEAIEAFDLPGSVPCYRVYDRQGNLKHQFSVDPQAEKQFTPEDVTQAIEPLL